jgi:murein DD-endopeptidase MepM/ murein hydrolase activator NlpD
LARRDRNVFTIMVVPHAETKVFTFRLSTIAFQALCYTLVCVFLFMIILARSYQTMLSNMWELEELRLVNREQRAQIEQLVAETRSLEQKMIILGELEKQVREMMEMESYSAQDASLASLSPLPKEPKATATIASAGAIGGPSLPGTISGEVVSRNSIAEARDALGMLGQINEEMGAQEEGLQEVRSAIAESMAFFSARPTGIPAFGYVSSRYGYRRTMYGSDQHGGYDIAGRNGTPIVATADGTVVFSGWAGAYGNMVEVEHAYGWSTVYGHCSKLAVSVGDRVKAGEVVGFIGSTGKSTGPHVHYEVRVNGRAVNPYYYLGDH